MNTYKVGSLFAGIGGICQAFKEAGCDVIWANEIDIKACSTYKLNHKNVNLIEGNIRQLSVNNLENIDILTAGFPCQPFSQAGHGKGFDDDRGQLFFDIIRLFRELKPKAYFLENVRTLATHDDKKTFNIIREELKNAGYSFIPFILNAAKYVEIPQGRERIYIVGFEGEENYSFNAPIKVNENNSNNDLLSKSFKIPQKLNIPNKSVRDFLDDSTIEENDIYNNMSNKIHRRVVEAVKNINFTSNYSNEKT